MTQKIKYDIFISHSSKDKWFSDKLYKLLDKAGFSIWYDYMSLIPNKEFKLSDNITNKIDECNNMIVILSENSIQSEWVILESTLGKIKPNITNIIWIKIDGCKLTEHAYFNSHEIKYIDCSNWMGTETQPKDESQWEAYPFFMILSAIYGSTENTRNQIDIYTSFPWSSGTFLLKDIYPKLDETQYRYIGDAQDQQSYDQDKRIAKIMSTCGAYIGILPYKEDKEHPKYRNTSHYILDEIKQAELMGLEGILFADSRVDIDTIKKETKYKIFTLKSGTTDNKDEIENHIKELKKILHYPSKPHVFFATNLNVDKDEINDMVIKLSGTVTATPCVTGENITNTQIQEQISQRIRQSYVMIADITGDSQCIECKKGKSCIQCKKGKSLSFRLNTCIEAGIARGANVDLYLIAQGKRQSPPFMFSDINVRYYNNNCELLAIIHQILRTHRRSVLNFEKIFNKVAQKELINIRNTIKDCEKQKNEIEKKNNSNNNNTVEITFLDQKIAEYTQYEQKLQNEVNDIKEKEENVT